MKKCNVNCEPVCDFCIHYEDDDKKYPNICAGEGVCKLDGHRTPIYGECDNFHCFQIKNT